MTTCPKCGKEVKILYGGNIPSSLEELEIQQKLGLSKESFICKPCGIKITIESLETDTTNR